MVRALFLAAPLLLSTACGREPEAPPWTYPPGDAKKTFDEVPLPELIARWRSLPKESSYIVCAIPSVPPDALSQTNWILKTVFTTKAQSAQRNPLRRCSTGSSFVVFVPLW